jgi:hypothetical protein
MNNVPSPPPGNYLQILNEIADLLSHATAQVGRVVNAAMTSTYWRIGLRIVEEEQRGSDQAEYGKRLVARLAQDLTARLGRGYSQPNLFRMRSFYLTYRSGAPDSPTKLSTPSRISSEAEIFSTAVDENDFVEHVDCRLFVGCSKRTLGR